MSDTDTFYSPPVRRFKQGHWHDLQENLAREVALSVSYAGGQCRLWAWPQDIPSLAAGHVLLDRLYQPGLLVRAEVSAATEGSRECRHGPCPQRVLLQPLSLTPEALAAAAAQALSPGCLSGPGLLAQMTAFIKAPGLWDNTGCFHRAAMLHPASGRLVRVAEDIGRHNCVDRLAGYAALHDPLGLNPARHVLLISARITASLYHKAQRAGFRCMVSRSAVTSGSLRAAEKDGVTLIGFCRPEEARLTVFTDPQALVAE